MNLLRFGNPGAELPGVLMPDGTRLDLSAHIPDYTPEFFAAGGMEQVKTLIRENGQGFPAVAADARLGPPIARPRKFIAIGQNYRLHVEEVGNEMPTEPAVFTKLTSCICGPDDDVVVPRASTKLDYEVELAFVMKNRVRYLGSEAEAMQHVAGFLICNDVSEREFQLERGGQWVKGKSHDTFGPLGPCLTPAEEVPDYGNLDLKLSVNGEVRQDSNSNDMIFGVPHLVWYLSQYFTLEPGDLVTTGTPGGVAIGKNDFPWLKAGDTMELSISKLGTQTQTVVAE